MTRRTVALGIVGLALALACPAAAYPPVTCGRFTYAGASYVVHSHGPNCGFANRWSKAFIAHRRKPRHFSCRGYGSSLPVYCKDAHRRYQYFFASLAPS
jgi:hypothetical protein